MRGYGAACSVNPGEVRPPRDLTQRKGAASVERMPTLCQMFLAHRYCQRRSTRHAGTFIADRLCFAGMDAAELLRSVRLRRGLTQAQLARRAGTTQTAISRLERGDRSPTTATLRRLLIVMGEDLELRGRPLKAEHDPAHLRAERALTPAQRLERAFDWMRFNAALAAAGRRIRR